MSPQSSRCQRGLPLRGQRQNPVSREETQHDTASSFQLLSKDEGQEGALRLLPPLPGPSWSPVAGPSAVSPGHLTQDSSAELKGSSSRRWGQKSSRRKNPVSLL